jgi:hypothetical protein
MNINGLFLFKVKTVEIASSSSSSEDDININALNIQEAGEFECIPTDAEVNGVTNMCVFLAKICIKSWFTAPSAIKAPNQDSQFLKKTLNYAAIEPIPRGLCSIN